MTTTMERRRMGVPGNQRIYLHEARCGLLGAAVGTATRSSAGRRIATNIRPAIATAAWGSALRGRYARRYYPFTLSGFEIGERVAVRRARERKACEAASAAICSKMPVL